MDKEITLDEVANGSSGLTKILVCPNCSRYHYRMMYSLENLSREFCVWCGNVQLEPLLKD